MAKKSFADNINSISPAAAYISASAPIEQPAMTARPAPKGFEPKSKRLQLLMRESLYQRIALRADSEGKSVNEFIHSILENALQ